MFQAVNLLSGDGGGTSGRCGPQIQECWEFEHPRRDAVLDDRGMRRVSPRITHADRLARTSSHEQSQCPFGQVGFLHPTCRSPAVSRFHTRLVFGFNLFLQWSCRIFRSGSLRQHRPEYPSSSKGQDFQGYAQLVPALFPIQGS